MLLPAIAGAFANRGTVPQKPQFLEKLKTRPKISSCTKNHKKISYGKILGCNKPSLNSETPVNMCKTAANDAGVTKLTSCYF